MGKPSLSLLFLGLGVLLLSCTDVTVSDPRSMNKCKNPTGKINQQKYLGCKSAVCSNGGKGGKPFWMECQQPATEEKQSEMIEIQAETREKVDQINNKQTNSIEKQDKIIENQNTVITLLRRIVLPVVFQKTEEFSIKRNNKLGELPFLAQQYIISFQLLITPGQTQAFGSVIHLTIGGDYRNYGDRTPALFTTNGGKSLLFASAIDGNPNRDGYLEGLTLSYNTWYNVEMSQLYSGYDVFFNIKVNGRSYVTIKNNDARSFQNVKIFAGDNFYAAAYGKIQFLKIRTDVDM